MGIEVGRIREFMKRNMVMIVMVPVMVGLHYGWQKIQDVEAFVPKNQRRDLPVLEGAKRIEDGIKNQLGLKKE